MTPSVDCSCNDSLQGKVEVKTSVTLATDEGGGGEVGGEEAGELILEKTPTRPTMIKTAARIPIPTMIRRFLPPLLVFEGN